MSDQDEIAPNPKKHDHAGHVIRRYISISAPSNHGLLVFVATEADLNSRRIEDVVAIPDLIAGALAEVLSQVKLTNRRPGTPLWLPVPEKLPEKASMILEWYGAQGFPLRRLAIVLKADDLGEVKVEVFSIARAASNALLVSSTGGLLGSLILN